MVLACRSYTQPDLEDLGLMLGGANTPVILRPLAEMNAPFNPMYGQRPERYKTFFQSLHNVMQREAPMVSEGWWWRYAIGR